MKRITMSLMVTLVLLVACESAPDPTSTSIATPTIEPPTLCSPSYPTVCIAPYPPDLDCGQVPHRRFRVLRPDPHGFDRDRDGVGCE